MDFEVIDFHTHPFKEEAENICRHIDYCDMSAENTPKYLKSLGISHICGSVLDSKKPFPEGTTVWDRLSYSNRTALELAEQYEGFYIPGFHVHPGYVRESCEEIERMAKRGVRLIGELVPYMDEWSPKGRPTDYTTKEFDEILDTAQTYNMVVSFHTMANATPEENDLIDAMVKKHPKVTFVAAHPGDGTNPIRHFERMKMSENYYLDLSGTGLFRMGTLRHGLDLFGSERFLFGSDFPICSPAMYLGEILLNPLYTDAERENILSRNAKRLLGIK